MGNMYSFAPASNHLGCTPSSSWPRIPATAAMAHLRWRCVLSCKAHRLPYQQGDGIALQLTCRLSSQPLHTCIRAGCLSHCPTSRLRYLRRLIGSIPGQSALVSPKIEDIKACSGGGNRQCSQNHDSYQWAASLTLVRTKNIAHVPLLPGSAASSSQDGESTPGSHVPAELAFSALGTALILGLMLWRGAKIALRPRKVPFICIAICSHLLPPQWPISRCKLNLASSLQVIPP